MGRFATYLNRVAPQLAMVVFNRPAAAKRWKNRLEKKVVDGAQLPVKGNKKSIVFFSVNKSGSSIATIYLRKLMKENKMPHVSYDGYLAGIEDGIQYSFKDEKFLERGFMPKGYFFGCFRSYRAIPSLDKYHVVVLLRDPRDVLVSQYYNLKFKNTVRTKKALESRRMAKQLSLDDHVMRNKEAFKVKYEDYIAHLKGKPNVLFTTFESMLSDSAHWLDAVAQHCNLDCSEALKADILTQINLKPRKEKKGTHIRKSQPGEFKKKLKSETVLDLNHTFSDVLNKLSYPV